MAPWVFALYVVVFAVLLTFPVSNFIYILSTRRLQLKMARALSDDERSGQRRRALVLAAFVCLVFSFLFSTYLVGVPSYG